MTSLESLITYIKTKSSKPMKISLSTSNIQILLILLQSLLSRFLSLTILLFWLLPPTVVLVLLLQACWCSPWFIAFKRYVETWKIKIKRTSSSTLMSLHVLLLNFYSSTCLRTLQLRKFPISLFSKDYHQNTPWRCQDLPYVESSPLVSELQPSSRIETTYYPMILLKHFWVPYLIKVKSSTKRQSTGSMISVLP